MCEINKQKFSTHVFDNIVNNGNNVIFICHLWNSPNSPLSSYHRHQCCQLNLEESRDGRAVLHIKHINIKTQRQWHLCTEESEFLNEFTSKLD